MDNTFDRMFYGEGEFIAGLDETGVVDIAGPLVAACVIIPKFNELSDAEDLRIFEVNDSKKVHEKYRKKLAQVIWECALGIGVGEVQPAELDFLGRSKAISLAMMRAIAACKTQSKKPIKPDFLLVDGELCLPTHIAQKSLKDGDEKSLCIAAASIIAKVYRDNIMSDLHQRFPYYGWNKNKGHPCENQFKGMDQYGIQAGIHRTRFWPFVPNNDRKDDEPRWRYRRGVWRQKTTDTLCEEVGEGIWQQTPELKNIRVQSSEVSPKSKKEPLILRL